MKYKVQLGKEKMSDREVRDSIDKAANAARVISQIRGESDKGHEAFRKKMERNAEMDKRDKKI